MNLINDRLNKVLLMLIAIALWGILIRSFFVAPALQAQSIIPEASKPAVITAHKLQLVDDFGKPCGSLVGEGRGYATLFLGTHGHNSVALSNGIRGGYLSLYDAKGDESVSIRAVESDYMLAGSGGQLTLMSDQDRTSLSSDQLRLTHGIKYVSGKTGHVVDVPLGVKSASFIQLQDVVQVPLKLVGQ